MKSTQVLQQLLIIQIHTQIRSRQCWMIPTWMSLWCLRIWLYLSSLLLWWLRRTICIEWLPSVESEESPMERERDMQMIISLWMATTSLSSYSIRAQRMDIRRVVIPLIMFMMNLFLMNRSMWITFFPIYRIVLKTYRWSLVVMMD